MSDTSKEALRLLNERMCAKVNDGRSILAENVADMLIAIRDLATERDALTAENDRLKARVARLEGALRDLIGYAAFGDDEYLSGHLRQLLRNCCAALKNKEANDE